MYTACLDFFHLFVFSSCAYLLVVMKVYPDVLVVVHEDHKLLILPFYVLRSIGRSEILSISVADLAFVSMIINLI